MTRPAGLLACLVLAALTAGVSASAHPPATRGATTPHGWTQTRTLGLVVALPTGFTEQPEGSGIAGARRQWSRPGEVRAPLAAAGALYVDQASDLPPGLAGAEQRSALVRQARTAELGVPPARSQQVVAVDGAQVALVSVWEWVVPAAPGGRAVPSRQVEVVLQTPGSQQFGVSLGGPRAYLTDALVDAFLDGLRFEPSGTAP